MQLLHFGALDPSFYTFVDMSEGFFLTHMSLFNCPVFTDVESSSIFLSLFRRSSRWSFQHLNSWCPLMLQWYKIFFSLNSSCHSPFSNGDDGLLVLFLFWQTWPSYIIPSIFYTWQHNGYPCDKKNKKKNAIWYLLHY